MGWRAARCGSREGLAGVAAHPLRLPLREELGGRRRTPAAAGGCWDGGGPCGGPGRARGHASGCTDVRKYSTRGKKAPVRTRRKGARKAERRGLRGLCEAEGIACGGRPLTDDTKNLDRPRPGAERVVRKRSGSGGSRRPTSKSPSHLSRAAPSKTFSRPKPHDLPTNSDAQPWFEGAGSRPRASRAHAWEAISGRLGVPR